MQKLKTVSKVKCMLIALTALVFWGCDITEPRLIEDSVPSDRYVLVWEENFEQESSFPNPDYWSYHTGYGTRPYGSGNDGWGNDEWQLYTNSQDNVRVEDGKMIISAQCPSGVPGKRNGTVTSARVHTKNKFDIRYGRIQAKIKVPTGMGMWPAFWMLGDNIDELGWPKCGEIDIMEGSPYLMGPNTTSFALHWEENGVHTYASERLELKNPLSDDFHIYEVEWDQRRIVGRINGMTYFVKAIDPQNMSEFFGRFFLILNLAVGGNMGGSPDETTEWPQNMYVDWIRVYQIETEPVETFGIFTDTTPVDDRITPGLNAEIYVWEETLAAGNTPPYEGPNVLSFITTGKGWFGGGIMSNYPLDLSDFENGFINFMIKIPANVTFEIGLIDALGRESYVEFPANETAFGLERNGEWGRAVIPVSEIIGDLNLGMLDYVFVFIERRGAECEFAIDDIYYSGGGIPATSVEFSSDLYSVDSDGATIKVSDIGSANNTVIVSVSNGTDNININVPLDLMGNGSGKINFGETDDETDTIFIDEGDVLTLTYTDLFGVVKTSSVTIIFKSDYFGIFTDLSPVGDGLTLGEDSEIVDTWFAVTMDPGDIPPYEGENVLTFKTPASGSWGAGIKTDQPMNFSDYSAGKINFMIKIPANADFRITILSSTFQQWTIEFGAHEAKYGLVRNGEWGRVSIPFSAFAGLNLSNISYPFFIQGTTGGNWEFAVDDVYYNK